MRASLHFLNIMEDDDLIYTRKHRSRREIAPKMKWTPREDELLRKAVKEFECRNWRMIAEKIAGRTSKQCLERWYGKLNPDLLASEYTPEEDSILIEKQKIFGNKWSQISTFLPGRSTISVRNRWDLLKRHERNPQLNNRGKKEKKMVEQRAPEIQEDQVNTTEWVDFLSGDTWNDLDRMFSTNNEILFDSYQNWMLS